MALIPDLSDTIAAIATPPGSGALGVIRVSGSRALEVVQPLVPALKLAELPSHTLHFARLREPSGAVLDEAVLSLFRAPRSYTREDIVELSCHGSSYILHRVLSLLTANGARPAAPGEFTLRAFMAGGMDLSQAEAVADLIAARSAQSQQLAMRQLRGGYSAHLRSIRERLVQFASLVELELDFVEEDVEFADRGALDAAAAEAILALRGLIESFAAGNAVKQGLPTVIVGRPNAGKSTLLNLLLQENRAIVSDIPGTTRDVIEDTLYIGGFEFRLMDTAGIRETGDVVEAEGVARTLAKVQEAMVVVLLYDIGTTTPADAEAYARELPLSEGAHLLFVANKLDTQPGALLPSGHIGLSAKAGAGLEVLTNRLAGLAEELAGGDTLVSNQRHLHALERAKASLEAVREGLRAGRPGDLLAMDIRHALLYLGEITGEITNDEILGNIFSKFCIGK